MKKWFKRIALASALVVTVFVAWVIIVFILPMYRCAKIHLHTYQTTSLAKLQEIAPHVLPPALDPQGGWLQRGGKDMPAELKELDPSWVSIDKDQVMIELHGGFDHFGFVYRKNDRNPTAWDIFRYSEHHEEEPLGTYTPRKPDVPQSH